MIQLLWNTVWWFHIKLNVLFIIWSSNSCCLVAKLCLTLFATPWTVAHQAPLSMRFPKQEYWKWVAISFSRGIFPTQGPNPHFLHCRWILYHWATREALLLGIYPDGVENWSPHRNLHMDAYRSFVHHCKTLEATKIFFNRRMDKLCYMQTMEYYSALKNKWAVNHSKIWRNLKYIFLSERSQSEKATCYVIPTLKQQSLTTRYSTDLLWDLLKHGHCESKETLFKVH